MHLLLWYTILLVSLVDWTTAVTLILGDALNFTWVVNNTNVTKFTEFSLHYMCTNNMTGEIQLYVANTGESSFDINGTNGTLLLRPNFAINPFEQLLIPDGCPAMVSAESNTGVVYMDSNDLMFTLEQSMSIESPKQGLWAIGQNMMVNISVNADITGAEWIAQLVSIDASNFMWTTEVELEVLNVSNGVGDSMFMATLPQTVKPDGKSYYLLASAGMRNSTFPMNYYTILDIETSWNNSDSLQFVAYDASMVWVETNASTTEFDRVYFNISGGGINEYFYLVAADTESSVIYGLGCMSRTLTNINTFAMTWNATKFDGTMLETTLLPEGIYTWQLWYTNVADDYSQVFLMNQGYQFDLMSKNSFTVKKESLYPIQYFGGTLNLDEDDSTKKLKLYSSFEEIRYVWQHNDNSTKNKTWVNVSKVKFLSLPKRNTSIEIEVSGVRKEDNNSTRVLFYSVNCDENLTFQAWAYAKIGGGSSKKNSSSDSSGDDLSAGAIVGIVCAGVFVCGLAAWWFCMRTKPVDQYQPIES